MDWRYAEQCRLRDTPARRGQGKDPGLETVVGEYIRQVAELISKS